MGKMERRARRQPSQVPQLKFVGYTPRGPTQVKLAAVWAAATCVVITGVAGTGKTTGPFGEALTDVLVRQRARKVYLTRPTMEPDEDDKLGFAPGDPNIKFAHWLAPFNDILGSLTGATLAALETVVETVPIAYARGRTVRNGTLLVDEAQNCTYKKLKLLLTRVGQGGRVVLVGDPDQCDLPRDKWRDGEVPLTAIARHLAPEPDVVCLKTTDEDQLRSDFVRRILKRLD